MPSFQYSSLKIVSKFLVTALFLVIFCVSNYAQSSGKKQKHPQKSTDFLVENAGDTLYGKYQKKLFGQTYFIPNNQKKLLLTPDTYEAYSFDGKLYRSIQLSPQTPAQWMECLENGKIKLYQYLLLRTNHPGPPSNDVIWLAQKNDGPLLNVNGITASQEIAKNNMARLLDGNQEALETLHQGNFNLFTIRRSIQVYNEAK